MGIAVHHHHDHWHWLHVAGHSWHRHAVAAWAGTTGTLVLVASLVLLTGRRVPGHVAWERLLVTPDVPASVSRSLGQREEALERAERALSRSHTPAARLDAARCAWELALVLPSGEDAQYQALLKRANDLLADPAVVDILTPRDRTLKAHVAVELAPLMDSTGAPRQDPSD